jgi:hypothetical protein
MKVLPIFLNLILGCFADSRRYHLAYWTEESIPTTLPELQVNKMSARNRRNERYFYLVSTLNFTVPDDVDNLSIQIFA